MAPYTFLIPETQECFIPLKARSKTPVDPGWPNSGRPYHEIDITKYNIGVLVGEQAGILDVDLDCFEANGLAEIILPTPSLVFNRGSADSAHYLYRGRSFGPCVQFASTTTGTLVELRGNGVQTMFPPSVHPNGSVLSCTKETPEADDVSYERLKKHVSLLAACAELAQNWTVGRRHKLALSFSGLCSKEGIPFDLLAKIIDRICAINGDIEIQDRLNAAKMSYGRPMGTAQGYLGLVELLGEQSASRIAERVRAYTKDETRELFTHRETNQVEFIRLDQFSDRTNLTEARIGNAFADWLDGKAVYVIESKQWMIWTGLYWELDQRSLMVQLAYAFVAEVKSELLHRGNHSDATNLGMFESLKKLENIVKLASTERSVSKADFDTDPFLLVANNTWVDLKTGEEITPNPDVLVSKVLAVPYSSDASCPLFLNFLEQVFEGNAELIRFVQKAVGYSLTGNTSEQCLFIMIGDVAVYDMAHLECPHGWDLHLMGNQYTTGLGSSKMAAVYKVYPEERERPLWVTVWFRAGSASIITENNRSYINAWVHPMYCEDKDRDCWIRMELPK